MVSVDIKKSRFSDNLSFKCGQNWLRVLMSKLSSSTQITCSAFWHLQILIKFIQSNTCQVYRQVSNDCYNQATTISEISFLRQLIYAFQSSIHKTTKTVSRRGHLYLPLILRNVVHGAVFMLIMFSPLLLLIHTSKVIISGINHSGCYVEFLLSPLPSNLP